MRVGWGRLGRVRRPRRAFPPRRPDPPHSGRRVFVWARVTDDAGETRLDEVQATLR